MDGDNVGFMKQRLKLYLMIPLLGRAVGGRDIDDSCAESACDSGNLPPDTAQSDDSPGLTLQFIEMLCKMCKNRVIRITVFLYIVIIVPQFFQKIEQHGEGMLCHGFRGIARHIAPCNAASVQVILVQIIGSGGGYAYQLQVLSLSDGLLVYLYFIYDQDIGISRPFRYLCRGGKGVFDHFS